MAKAITNVAASVHARLLRQARGGSRSFNDLLQLYAMERFLHRLSRTPHANRFVLKGGLLLRAWDTATFRTTRDIDLLGRGSNEIMVLEGVMRDACSAAVDPDGLQFDSASVRGETIVEDADYPGVRVTFDGSLGNARLDMQVDVGYGDTVTPEPQELEFPTLLPMAGTRLLAYPPETVVAEKLQVMIFRAEAIRATCAKRGTDIPEMPTVLTQDFGANADKRTQWRAFRRRFGTTGCPEEFETVIALLRVFLVPVIATVRSGQPTRLRWDPLGGWNGS